MTNEKRYAIVILERTPASTYERNLTMEEKTCEKDICEKCGCEIDGPTFQNELEEIICEDCMIQSMAMKINLIEE